MSISIYIYICIKGKPFNNRLCVGRHEETSHSHGTERIGTAMLRIGRALLVHGALLAVAFGPLLGGPRYRYLQLGHTCTYKPITT